MKHGPLVILSAPSGGGKSTVIRRLLAQGGLALRLSVSATTRRPRPSEKDGVHYHFWSREQFLDQIDRDGFLEWAEVHGNLYGTLRNEVNQYRERGIGVLLDVDVQGAEQVRARSPEAISIFLLPPSFEELEQRLRARGTEDEASIRRRLAAAEKEIERASEYNHQLINADLNSTVAQVRALLEPYLVGDRNAG